MADRWLRGFRRRRDHREEEPAHPAADPLAAGVSGRVLDGTFEVGPELGAGGMGRVDRVRHLRWQQDLAMKSPRPEAWAGQRGAEAFLDEARLWVGLPPHPNICACHYVRVIDGVPRVFAELVERGSVADALGRGEIAGLDEVLDVAIQAAWGLAAAHRAGVVHQDVKPGNLLRDGDGTVKVTDFGLARARARAVGAASATPLSPTGGESVLVTGRGMTPAYASPEQLAGEAVGRRTDVWSWAVSVLELFVGGVSWLAGPVAPEVLDALVAGDPPPGRPRLPEPVAELLRECFAADPRWRPADLDELARRLVEVHDAQLGTRYPRQATPAATEIAAGLNNRALSLLDLGDAEQAQRCWEEALRADPGHAEATYNRGLWRWRQGRITDRDVVVALTAHSGGDTDDAQLALMHALVHRERGDLGEAEAALGAAPLDRPEDPERAALRAEARSAPATTRAGTRLYGVVVALTRDGAVALTDDGTGGLACWTVGAPDPTASQTIGGVVAASIDPAGSFALVVTPGGTVHVWDTRADRRAELVVASGATAVALADDTGAAVTVGTDGLRVWRLEPGRHAELVATAGDGPLFAVAVDAAARTALTGAHDGTMTVWDLASGAPRWSVSAHARRVTALALTPDGRQAVSAGRDDVLRHWDLATGRCLRTIDLPAVTALALAKDGRRVHVGDASDSVRTIALGAGPPAPWRYSVPRRASELAAEARGFRGLLAEARGLLDAGEHARAAAVLARARTTPGHERHPDLRDLWRRAGRTGRRSGLLDARQTTVLGPGTAGRITVVGLHPDGRHALTGGLEGELQWWDLEAGTAQRTVAGPPGWFRAAAVVADTSCALVACQDGGLQWRDFDTGEHSDLPTGHAGAVQAVAATPDGRFAVTGAKNGLHCWDVLAGECGRMLAVPGGVAHVALTPDGRRALTGAYSGMDRAPGPPPSTVHWWDLTSGRLLLSLDEHDAASVAVTPDGRLGLTGSASGRARLWDLATGTCLRDLGPGSGRVVAITPDGGHAVTAGAVPVVTAEGVDEPGREVRVWDLATGACLRVLRGHTDDVRALTVSADLRFLLTAGWDATARVWELDWDYAFGETP